MRWLRNPEAAFRTGLIGGEIAAGKNEFLALVAGGSRKGVNRVMCPLWSQDYHPHKIHCPG